MALIKQWLCLIGSIPLFLFPPSWLMLPHLAAYKHADGKKIDGRRVLVDVERGRTVKGWQPRRLGEELQAHLTARTASQINLLISATTDILWPKQCAASAQRVRSECAASAQRSPVQAKFSQLVGLMWNPPAAIAHANRFEISMSALSGVCVFTFTR